MLWLGAVAVAGCASISDDLSSLGEKLTPITPNEAVRMMVDPHDPDDRRRGTVLISNSPFGGADAYVAMYRDRVRNEQDPLARAAAISALGRHGEPKDAPSIAANLDDEHFQVRWEAAKALQRIHNPVVVPDLLRTVREVTEQPDIRVAATVALGQYPQDRVCQVLVGVLDGQGLAVNVAADWSLTTLTGMDFGLDVRAWLGWYNSVDDPFADRQVYLYPTYQREETFLEKLAFWSNEDYEQPGPPAGLEPPPRRTYQDDDGPSTDETGG